VGCDQLAKIMPSAQAAANRALQIALQQINGLRNTTPAVLAGILQ
jgi:PPE-repeat protein